MSCQFAARVSRKWAGLDSVREQRKLEARKMLENAAESPASSARCVGQPPRLPKRRLKKIPLLTRTIFTSNFDIDNG